MRTSLSYKIAQISRKYGYNPNSHEDDTVKQMRQEISALGPAGISFSISVDRDGVWYAEATNVDGLLTGGDNINEIDEMLKDAIFTYFGISPKHCDDKLLRSSSDVKVLKQQVSVAT